MELFRNRLPLIQRVSPQLITPFLQLRERDQVYTAFAVLEAINQLEPRNKKLADELTVDLLSYSAANYNPNEQEAIKSLAQFLQALRSHDPTLAVRMAFEMIRSANPLVRIAGCRNAIELAPRFPGEVLKILTECAGREQPVNLRRPVARERPVDFVVRLLRDRALRREAEALLRQLLSDPDSLVRIPTFDKIEAIAIQDRALALSLCDYVIANDPAEVLVERARRVNASLRVTMA